MEKINVLRGRKLSLGNAVLIGSGFCSDVYQIDDETVVKVLKRDTEKDAEREILLSKWAFTKGIPTAISYDVVDVNGRPGLVYEMLGKNNLRNALRDRPEDFDALMEKYLDLLHTIGKTEVGDEPLPEAITDIRGQLEEIKETVSADEYRKMSALLDTVPAGTTLVHRDCHVKNIKLVNGEPVLIDLDTLSRGDPILELAPLYCTYRVFPTAKREYEFDAFLDIPVTLTHKIIDTILENYYPHLSPEAKKRNKDKIALLAHLGILSFIAENPDAYQYDRDAVAKEFRELLAKTDDLALEK